jgi:surface antigen
VTTKPKIGDIAYFTTNQHHAVVVGVNGDSIQIVNGNGLGGKVTVSTTTRAAVTAFYSIVPLLMGVL